MGAGRGDRSLDGQVRQGSAGKAGSGPAWVKRGDGRGAEADSAFSVPPAALPQLLHARLGHRHRRRDLNPRRVSLNHRCLLRTPPPAPNPTLADIPSLPPSLFSENVFLAPSGVQKERIQPEDIFVLSLRERQPLRWPVHKPLTQSQCTPLFYNCYDQRDAGACIHTHSQHAVMATLLWKGTEFRLSHQEMIKGMRVGGTGKALSYLDTLVIPIIENTPFEEDLKESMAEAMRKYPDAVSWVGRVARRGGQEEADFSRGATRSLLCSCAGTGPTRGAPTGRRQSARLVSTATSCVPFWAARMGSELTLSAGRPAECLDYLLEIAVKMRLAGMETEGLH